MRALVARSSRSSNATTYDHSYIAKSSRNNHNYTQTHNTNKHTNTYTHRVKYLIEVEAKPSGNAFDDVVRRLCEYANVITCLVCQLAVRLDFDVSTRTIR
jgi:hypothetical protein